MFGIKFVATECKEYYFDHLLIELAVFITMRSASYIYILSITLSPALAQKYSGKCLGVLNRPISL